MKDKNEREPLLDRDGLTEKEYLARYDRTKWDRPSYTADCLIAGVGKERRRGEDVVRVSMLLVRRANHPYLGYWAMPGGFVEPGETGLEAAARELEEETGLTNIYLEPFYFASTPGRDPRGWTVSEVFFGTTPLGAKLVGMAGDDAMEIGWFDIRYDRIGEDRYSATLKHNDEVIEIKIAIARDMVGNMDFDKSEIIENTGMAFDHGKMVFYLLQKLSLDLMDKKSFR